MALSMQTFKFFNSVFVSQRCPTIGHFHQTGRTRRRSKFELIACSNAFASIHTTHRRPRSKRYRQFRRAATRECHIIHHNPIKLPIKHATPCPLPFPLPPPNFVSSVSAFLPLPTHSIPKIIDSFVSPRWFLVIICRLSSWKQVSRKTHPPT